MTRSLLAATTLAALVALSACSSSDDDEETTSPADNASVEPVDGASQTSELVEDREVSSEPGGDTTAIAGYWDAPVGNPGTDPGTRFVLVTEDGLQTSFERQLDDVSEEVCYSQAGPQTLTPNGDDVYTPADGSASFVAMRSEDGGTLTVTADDIVETWTLVEDGSPDDLVACSVS